MIRLQSNNTNCKYYIQNYSVTVVEGKDSVSHINRIITSNISNITNLEYCESLICDANGKIIDAIGISNISEQLLILGIPRSAEKTRELIVSGIHWNEEVKIMNGDGALSIITIFGDNIEEIKKILGEDNVNQKIGIWKEVNNYYTLNIDLKLDSQVNILIQNNSIEEFTKTITGKGVELSDKDTWDIHRIRNGILSEQEYNQGFLPTELALDRIVDLKKGCYPGQEIHARLESRGKVSKKIIRYSTDSQIDIGTYKSDTGRKIRITSNVNGKGLAVVSVKEKNPINLDDKILLLTEEL